MEGLGFTIDKVSDVDVRFSVYNNDELSGTLQMPIGTFMKFMNTINIGIDVTHRTHGKDCSCNKEH